MLHNRKPRSLMLKWCVVLYWNAFNCRLRHTRHHQRKLTTHSQSMEIAHRANAALFQCKVDLGCRECHCIYIAKSDAIRKMQAVNSQLQREMNVMRQQLHIMAATGGRMVAPPVAAYQQQMAMVPNIPFKAVFQTATVPTASHLQPQRLQDPKTTPENWCLLHLRH